MWRKFALPLLIASACVAAAPLAAQTRAPAAMAVTVAKAKRACFADTIQVSGVLVSKDEVLVRPDSEGMRITQVLVEAGDTVVAGQILARLTVPEGQQTQPGAATTVQAPIAGVVNARAAVVGAMASARAEPLFRITTRGEVELMAEISARRLARLTVGQAVRVDIVGVGELGGRVRLIGSEINPMTQMAQLRIFIGSDARLRLGAFGRATVNVGQSCGAAIPLSAVLYGTDGAVVQVVRDDRVETRRVRVGLLAGGTVEIREGLAEGDMVVARAGAFLREGDRVKPVAAD
jgi:HlyD family secretion protein